MFANEDISRLLKLCDKIITRGQISEIRIRNELSKMPAGQKLLGKFTLFQLKNRIKYERRKIVLSFRKMTKTELDHNLMSCVNC